MSSQTGRPAQYLCTQEAAGFVFRFFCEACGAAVCVTEPSPARTQEEALARAWQTQGRLFLNRCHRCGRWVCDTMYNVDMLECVDCSPWEERPEFCTQCGEKVEPDQFFCHACHSRLLYGRRLHCDESSTCI